MITDPFNPPDNQTCTYGADDLSRIASINCVNGTTKVWNQNFSYDAFGNITKSSSGPGSAWMPGYDATSHYLAGSGSTYDADGNLTQDPSHVYTWDVYGNPATIDSTTLIYDALDREVEKQSGTAFTEFAFGPTGKLAIMNGQTQTKAFVALPGGTQVKYAGNAISTYRLPDWLGSLRAGSNPNRTYSWGIAFAPFGEQYAISGSPALSFTGEEGTADTVSDEYDFLARKQNPAQGRWISPDPAGVEAVDPTNPQSWNRYAYVQNSPLTFTDPSGLILDPQVPSCSEDASCEGGYSHDPLSCNPSDIFCAPDPARGVFPIPNWPPPQRIPALNIFPGENSVNIGIGSGNPLTDIWQDALGLPTIPCGAQFGPWCDPGKLPNPWILDAEPGVPNIAKAGQSWLDCYNGFHDSAGGRATEFFSALSWLPVDNNWKSNIKESATFGLAKASTVGLASHFGKGLLQGGAKALEYVATGVFATASAVDSTVFVGCGGAALDTVTPGPSRVR